MPILVQEDKNRFGDCYLRHNQKFELIYIYPQGEYFYCDLFNLDIENVLWTNVMWKNVIAAFVANKLYSTLQMYTIDK